jgi:hypothetical protein
MFFMILFLAKKNLEETPQYFAIFAAKLILFFLKLDIFFLATEYAEYADLTLMLLFTLSVKSAYS